MNLGLLEFLSYLGSLSDRELIVLMLSYLGPPVFLGLFVPMWFLYRLYNKRRDYITYKTKYVLLAIDVPKETEQSPKAVESVFTALAATYSKPNKYQCYWLGQYQEPFSFEIASLGGYIQFFIRTPVQYRDLVEAAIYAQYPDAEIVESEDYIDRIPSDFNTEQYDLWGTEFVLDNKDIYPIRTYVDFEHQTPEDFKDPMAALLEILSRINSDEDVWLQLLIIPIDDKWKEEGVAEVKKITEGYKAKHSAWTNLGSGVIETLRYMGDSLIPYAPTEEAKTKKDEMGAVPTIIKLTPGQRDIVAAIERKISKIGFRVKFRMVYWGRRDTFLKGRGVNAVVGAIKQFTALNLNGFKTSKLITTKADYILTKQRITRKQKKILRAYKLRSPFRGAGLGRILNTEELATVYHFPVMTVRAPLVRKTELKKAEPPFTLPVFTKQTPRRVMPTIEARSQVKGKAPTNLPIVE